MEFNDELLTALPQLRRYALKLTRDADRSQDLVQDTVALALQHRDQYQPQPGASFVAWLITIMRNLHYTERRRSSRYPTISWDNIYSALTPSLEESYMGSREIAETRHLTAEQVDLISSVALRGESYEDISVRVGLPPSAVRSRLHRARAALRVLTERTLEPA